MYKDLNHSLVTNIESGWQSYNLLQNSENIFLPIHLNKMYRFTLYFTFQKNTKILPQILCEMNVNGENDIGSKKESLINILQHLLCYQVIPYITLNQQNMEWLACNHGIRYISSLSLAISFFNFLDYYKGSE